MIDARREANHIFKELGRFQKQIGEALVWFKFDITSEYDDVYDEGGRFYSQGILVPALYVDQQEDPEQYEDTGRRPTYRLRTAVSARSLHEVTVGASEAHGGRSWDIKPDAPWWDDRLNDIFYYDGRFYEVSTFNIRGRVQGLDTIVGIGAIETQIEDERVWDLFPGTQPEVAP